MRKRKMQAKDLLTIVMLAAAGDLSRIVGLNLLNDVFNILAIFGAIVFVVLYFFQGKTFLDTFARASYLHDRIDTLESEMRKNKKK